MLQFIKQLAVFQFKTSVGIHLHLNDNGSNDYRITVLKKQWSAINLVKQYTSIEDFINEHKSALNSVFFHLTITGKSVIIKKATYSEENNNPLSAILPGAKPNDFSYDITESDDSTLKFISVIRNETLTDLINGLSEKGINIGSLYFGPFSLELAIHLLDIYDPDSTELTIPHFQLKFKKTNFAGIITTENEANNFYNLKGLKISSDQLISYCTALNHFRKNQSQPLCDNVVQNVLNESVEKQFFYTLSRKLLVLLVLVLVPNTIFFQVYYNRVCAQASLIEFHKKSLNKLEFMKNTIKKQESLLNDSLTHDSGFFTKLTDKVWQSVPSEIALTSMNINPKLSAVNSISGRAYEKNKFILTGLCKESIILSAWMTEMMKIEEIKNVAVLNYKQDNKENSGTFNLSVELK
jgi:hypothetical protein